MGGVGKEPTNDLPTTYRLLTSGRGSTDYSKSSTRPEGFFFAIPSEPDKEVQHRGFRHRITSCSSPKCLLSSFSPS